MATLPGASLDGRQILHPRTALADICGVPEKNQNGGSYLVGTPRTLLRKMEKQAGVRTSCQSVRSL